MKKSLVLAMLVMIISFACGSPALTAAPATVPPSMTPNLTATAIQSQNQMSTFVAQTMQAQPPAATETAVPPTAQPPSVAIKAGQNWGGIVNWQGYTYPVTLAIVKVKDSSFNGAMAWSAQWCKVTTSVKGDIIQDISAATEQDRWAQHPDFISGDKSGAWLRWTQIESIGSQYCYLSSMNDWWYAHIGSDGHGTAIHFQNSTDANPDSSVSFRFTLSSP